MFSMTGFVAGPLPVTNSIYVSNLPPGTDETLLADHFGQIGLIKKDKRTNRPKIWIYRDKATNEPKGDATVTYEDPHAAAAAVDWFNGKDFHGSIICVSIAESKHKESAEPTQVAVEELAEMEAESDQQIAGDTSGVAGLGRGRGRGEPGAKAWQQEGDWPCPNPSCANINFAFRGVCNRCGSARPSGGPGGGANGGGRGRGRGAQTGEGAGRGARGPGGPPGLFGPNDWNCPMCGNINWAKRTKCNICNTTKPGHNEGGVREGRAGGYKEFDEAEIEETRRRRKELEEDDGEMYDEFGNLKKKFRVKLKQGEVQNQQVVSGVGKAGWEKEELGVVEPGKSKERSKDRGDKESDWERDRIRDISGKQEEGRNGHRGYRDSDFDDDVEKDRGRERERPERDRHDSERGRHTDRDNYRERDRSRERDWSRDQDRDRDRGRVKDRDRYREQDRDRDRGSYRGRDYDSERDGARDRLRTRDMDRFLD